MPPVRRVGSSYIVHVNRLDNAIIMVRYLLAYFYYRFTLGSAVKMTVVHHLDFVPVFDPQESFGVASKVRNGIKRGLAAKLGKTVTFRVNRPWSHTHTLNGPCSGTTSVSWYQKGKTDLNFTEARDSEWQWHQLGRMKVCISLQRNNDANYHSVFYRPNALPATQPTA